MKRGFIIFFTALMAVGPTAFGVISCSPSEKEPAVELNYRIGSKFGATVTKAQLQKAVSVADILPEPADWSTYRYQSLTVTVYHDETEQSDTGENLEFTEAQLQLLRDLDYSYGFKLTAPCNGKHGEVDREEYELYYPFTVTPENEAEYSEGQDALIAYLKENGQQESAAIDEDKLGMGAVHFTVSKNGELKNVNLSSSSGYDSLDELMMDLFGRLPGTWEPASDPSGEKHDQEFIFSFGAGC